MGEAPWWQRGVIYQIYPRSWMDSDGDGVGDLRGILARLDYLTWLGVDAIWLSPVYPSPLADLGYDVADYCDIDPEYGTLADFDRLLVQAHDRGLRVLLDWVPNHTSDQHPWFLQSRSSRDDPKRDWYVWRDGKPGGGPPSNWLTYAGESAWRWDERTGQYYYRVFLDQQPDLNWRNPAVQAAMFDTLRFWLARGVDGFRVDVLSLLVEDDQLRDNPANPDYRPGEDFPFMRERSAGTWTAPRPASWPAGSARWSTSSATTGCCWPSWSCRWSRPLPTTAPTATASRSRSTSSCSPPAGRPAASPATSTATWPRSRRAAGRTGCWATTTSPASPPGSGRPRPRVAAMLLLTLPGTPTLYYGDELGLRDVPIPPELVRDPIARLIPGRGRDPERTPMQWDGGPGAGFTTGRPWLPVANNHGTVNVAAQRDDPASPLHLHRRLLDLRRHTPALLGGAYEPVEADGDVLVFLRTGEGRPCRMAAWSAPAGTRRRAP